MLGLVSRVTGSAPLSLRLAARDAGRSRGRAGPATVAAMLALAGAIGGTTMLRSSEAQVEREQVAYLGKDQLRVDFTPAEPRPTPAETDDVLAAVLGAVPGAVGSRLSDITPPDGRYQLFAGPQPGVFQYGDVVAGGPGPESVVAVVDVAALDAIGAGIARDAFEAGQVVAVNGGTVDAGGTVTLRTSRNGQVEDLATVRGVEVEGEARYGLPTYLMSSGTAATLGLVSRPSAVVVRAPRAVTEADVRRVNLAVLQAVPSVPVYVQSAVAYTSGGKYLLPTMLGAGALVALFVVGLVTALSREELRPHLGTLAAVGAAPRTRRRLAAAQSGLLAGLAAVLAIPAGLIPAVTLLSARSADVEMVQGGFDISLSVPPVVVPWLPIAALVVGGPSSPPPGAAC
jgi:putative ABC transport system permease protein